MATEGASISFTLSASEEVAWESKEALQTFFEGIRVPPASDDYGVVKQVSMPDEIEATITVDTDSITVLDQDSNANAEITFLTESYGNSLKTRIDDLTAKYNTLIQRLKDSGIGA